MLLVLGHQSGKNLFANLSTMTLIHCIIVNNARKLPPGVRSSRIFQLSLFLKKDEAQQSTKTIVYRGKLRTVYYESFGL